MAFMVGSIQAKLQLDSGGYTRGMLNAQSMNAVFGQSVTNFINNPLLGTIGIFKSAVTGIARYSVELVALAEHHQRLANQTGVSTDVTQAMTREFELAGRATTQAEQALRTFNTRLAQARDVGGPAADVFAQLGVNVGNMRSTDAVLRDTVDSLLAYENVAASAAVAAQLFGEEAGGAVVETVASGGGLDEMIAKYKDFGLVMDRSVINRMAELNTRSGEAKLAIEGLRQSLTASFTETATEGMKATTEDVRELSKSLRDDLTPAAEGAGVAVQYLLERLQRDIKITNSIGEFLGDVASAASSPLRKASNGAGVVSVAS